jgi:general stress protein 26
MKPGGAIERGMESAKKIAAGEKPPWSKEEGFNKSQELAERSEIAMVGSIGNDGYPNIKAMFKIEAEGLKTIWFSTNTSSKRVSQFRENPKACVYFFDSDRFAGLLLVGDIEIMLDPDSKNRFWHEGWEVYYSLGPTDPDYCLLKFSAKWGNYYHGLQNISFEI